MGGGGGGGGDVESESAKKKKCKYVFIKFQVPSSSGSLVLKQTKGVMNGWMDRQMDGPKPIYSLNFFEAGGITMHKCRSY